MSNKIFDSLHAKFEETANDLSKKGGIIEQMVAKDQGPQLPPSTTATYPGAFLTINNPSGGANKFSNIFYNPDRLWRTSQENSSRMLYDLAVFAPLMERLYATAVLPYSIVPQNGESPEEREAADYFKDIVEEWLDFPDFKMNLLFAAYYGRQGSVVDYQFDFSKGERRMIPKGWFGIHGDTILMDNSGLAGFLVGAFQDVPPGLEIQCVEGRGQRIPDTEKDAWCVHHFLKLPGEWRLMTTGARMWGQGLRDFCSPTWFAKNELWGQIFDFTNSFGGMGKLIWYFEYGNPESLQNMQDAAQKNRGAYDLLVPRKRGDMEGAEGIDVINPPQGLDDLLKLINNMENWLRLAITGQQLTAESHNVGLSSKTGQIHEHTFGRLIKFDAAILDATLTDQFLWVLQKNSKYRHLPKLRFEHSFELGDTHEQLENAVKLHEMGVRVNQDELLAAAGFEAAPIQTGLPTDTGKAPEKEEENKELENFS